MECRNLFSFKNKITKHDNDKAVFLRSDDLIHLGEFRSAQP